MFIPEGWWHQINSTGGTIAVNIWWRSAFDRQLGSQMDSYYLRRTLQSLMETHKAQAMKQPPAKAGPATKDVSHSQSAGAPDGFTRQEHKAKRQRIEQDSSRNQPGMGTKHSILLVVSVLPMHACTVLCFLAPRQDAIW